VAASQRNPRPSVWIEITGETPVGRPGERKRVPWDVAMRLEYFDVAARTAAPVEHRPRLEDTEWWRVMMTKVTEYQAVEVRAGHRRPSLHDALVGTGHQTVLKKHYPKEWPSPRTLERWERRWAELHS
jgi:hypothetical protein